MEEKEEGRKTIIGGISMQEGEKIEDREKRRKIMREGRESRWIK